MKTLVIEDDFISRKLLQAIIMPFGTCEIAVDGIEAVEAFRLAVEEGNPYDLLCLDIMMPNMDGQEVLKRIRMMEREAGTGSSKKAKVIMTTALDDFDNIKAAFTEKCDAYIVKPVNKDKFFEILRELELIK